MQEFKREAESQITTQILDTLRAMAVDSKIGLKPAVHLSPDDPLAYLFPGMFHRNVILEDGTEVVVAPEYNVVVVGDMLVFNGETFCDGELIEDETHPDYLGYMKFKYI